MVAAENYACGSGELAQSVDGLRYSVAASCFRLNSLAKLVTVNATIHRVRDLVILVPSTIGSSMKWKNLPSTSIEKDFQTLVVTLVA
jgi:hypothetical protein